MTAGNQPQEHAAEGTPSTPNLHVVVGYDGSPPADRALDGAVRLLQGRAGDVAVTYIAHIPAVDMLSPDAVAQLEVDFDEIEKELRGSSAGKLDSSGIAWQLLRRDGPVAHELIEAAVAIRDAHPGDTVVIVVGSAAQAGHRILGSVAVSLARHCPVPLVIVP